ncbi:MAG: Small heat shock protein [Candidatus Magasanikbacteria bacterium GW2011_GWC2_37_14]|uniref:Small heat shock protein n=1 Tax=Candidatus Magasanikbacteria bacterium GW2011_GWC2_37_14 TaxID=1619046 RepID=A0A0G0GCD7_9BACT|nr:MAG: Small heat shock protein [Candidatus Magasanikbacteria bacterium GW2011_GWC2_37_14]
MSSGQVKKDVFQMILESNNGAHGKAEAKRADFAFPDNWHEEQLEGQLAVDVAETVNEIVIVSTMAGAEFDKIEVFLHNDLLTIRGARNSPLENNQVGYFHEECFWGKFSRTIILPMEVKGDLAKAEYKNGVLTITVPKLKIDRKIPVMIVED